MSDAIVTLNAGSSSLKFAVFEVGETLTLKTRGQVEGLFTLPRFVAKHSTGETIAEHAWAETELGHSGAIDYLFRWGREALHDVRIVAAGHRVGHRGRTFTRPVLVDDQVMAELERFVPLAPLHQPHNLGAIRAVAERAPGLPQVACFDTAFHRTQPTVAQAFALPHRFTEEGVIRYGFHGLSYEYIASELPRLDEQAAAGRTVVAHLGSGVSMCALRNGQSVATTMSFTPLDGLPMGTRCGAIDPGVLLYLMDHHHMDARDRRTALS
jgi:acetate kinase